MKKISYKELSEDINTYLEKLNLNEGVNPKLKKEYLYQEIKDNLELIKSEFNNKETLELSKKKLLISNEKFMFLIEVEDEEKTKSISVKSIKKDKFNNRFEYLLKDSSFITIDKESGDYSIKEDVREAIKDNDKEYDNTHLKALSKVRNFTKEGLEKNEIIYNLKRTLSYEKAIDFDSFNNSFFISDSDYIIIANRVYFDIINYIEIDNKGNEIYNGYKTLEGINGYRKFNINNDVLDSENVSKLSEKTIKEKLNSEKDEEVKELLTRDYTANREKFTYKKAEKKLKYKVK